MFQILQKKVEYSLTKHKVIGKKCYNKFSFFFSIIFCDEFKVGSMLFNPSLVEPSRSKQFFDPSFSYSFLTIFSNRMCHYFHHRKRESPEQKQLPRHHLGWLWAAAERSLPVPVQNLHFWRQFWAPN